MVINGYSWFFEACFEKSSSFCHFSTDVLSVTSKRVIATAQREAEPNRNALRRKDEYQPGTGVESAAELD